MAILGLLAVHIPCNRVCALNKESCDDQMIMVLQALTPQMTENKKRVEELLREALVLQAALESETEAGLLERLLPKRYKQYQKGISSRA